MAEETDWKAALPEELKTAPALKDVKDIPGLAKRFIDTQAMVGASIRRPGPDAGPEALKEFALKLAEVPGVVYLPEDPAAREVAQKDLWKKLGRPDDPKAYTADGVQLEPDVTFTEPELDAMRATATKRGYTKEQFRALVKDASEGRAQALKSQKEQRAALQRELGAAFEERTLVAAIPAEKRGFPEEVVRALRNGSVDLKTFKAFDSVARGFGEARQVADQAGGGGGGKPTPAEARAQRSEIMARPEYFRPTAAQMAVHESLKVKVQELNEYIEQAG